MGCNVGALGRSRPRGLLALEVTQEAQDEGSRNDAHTDEHGERGERAIPDTFDAATLGHEDEPTTGGDEAAEDDLHGIPPAGVPGDPPDPAAHLGLELVPRDEGPEGQQKDRHGIAHVGDDGPQGRAQADPEQDEDRADEDEPMPAGKAMRGARGALGGEGAGLLFGGDCPEQDVDDDTEPTEEDGHDDEGRTDEPGRQAQVRGEAPGDARDIAVGRAARQGVAPRLGVHASILGHVDTCGRVSGQRSGPAQGRPAWLTESGEGRLDP